MRDRQLTAVVWATAIGLALLLLLNGVGLPAGFFGPVSKVASAVVLLGVVFERWAWRWPGVRTLLAKRPYVQGTWQVEIRSDYIDPSTGSRIAPITGYLVVRQTYSRLGIQLLTPESLSRLRGVELATDADNLSELLGIYVNEPSVHVRHRSPMHYGALTLRLQGDLPSEMVGHYWTDRGTRGELHTRAHSRVLYPSFAAAEVAFRSAPPTAPAPAAP